MARIEGIQIQNYRSLKDVTLGKTIENQKPEPLNPSSTSKNRISCNI